MTWVLTALSSGSLHLDSRAQRIAGPQLEPWKEIRGFVDLQLNAQGPARLGLGILAILWTRGDL